jgi:prephenate dehydratase
MRLGYLGPAGTYCEEALRASAPQDDGSELVPYASVYDTVRGVAGDDVDRALVPIENSIEGPVTAAVDAIAVEFPGVAIVGETILPIHHCLIGRTAIETAAIETVVSHPQATAQCARFLRTELPGARVVAAGSTAEAVRAVAEASEPAAAIGTRLAAMLYGGVILREGIADDPDNTTRFVWLAGPGAGAAPWPAAGDGDGSSFKTSIVFAGAGDDSPGWLVRCLSEFAFRGVNLSKIESRPRRGRLGHYWFLLDLDGRLEDPPVGEAIASLRKHCEEVRVMGSYPAAPAS